MSADVVQVLGAALAASGLVYGQRWVTMAGLLVLTLGLLGG